MEDADDVMLKDLSSTLLIEALADIPLIQANVVIIGKDTRDLYVPTSIEKLVINPALHASKLRDVSFKKNKRKYLTSN